MAQALELALNVLCKDEKTTALVKLCKRLKGSIYFTLLSEQDEND